MLRRRDLLPTVFFLTICLPSSRMIEVSDKAEQLLDAAEDLCRTVGFNAFSYRDLADRVGIRTASIHYHFPGKADLGRAMAMRYRERFEQALGGILRSDPTANGRWNAFASALQRALGDGDKLCLGGMLSAEFSSLAPEIQTEVTRFFQAGESFVSHWLTAGVTSGELRLPQGQTADVLARSLFSSMQGAMLAARACKDPTRLQSTSDWILETLRA